MAGTYRGLVHYYFKKGMEEKAIQFIKNELTNHAQHYGNHDIELLRDEMNPQHWIASGIWNSVEEARNFQSYWNPKEQELLKFCTSKPHHEIYKIQGHLSKKMKRAA